MVTALGVYSSHLWPNSTLTLRGGVPGRGRTLVAEWLLCLLKVQLLRLPPHPLPSWCVS